MAIDHYEIVGDLELRPTADSRARMTDFGIESVDAQDRCYGVLAERLGAAERARQAEKLAAAALHAEYLALIDHES